MTKKKVKKSSVSPGRDAIRSNRPREQTLPIELRDFAELLAEIAAQQLCNSTQSKKGGSW